MIARQYRMLPGDDFDDSSSGGKSPFESYPYDDEDLPYRVELWNAAQTEVDQVLAVTVSASLGYAAYYAATRDFPGRHITLRHKNRIVSRWNTPTSQ